MSRLYLDYNATTPLDPAVLEDMRPFLTTIQGNPSSVHAIGQEARAALDDARYRLAAVWGCKPSEAVFTSGGTEANNLAIFGSARLRQDRGRHLVASTIEHHAVLHCFESLQKHEGFSVTWISPDAEGRIRPSDVADAIRPDTTLVSVMAANNETGAIQPVSEIGLLCRERGVLFHTDAIQCFGKLPFRSIHQFNADLVTACAHKFHGPKGSGALFIRSPLLPRPILFGGGHENERRAGTENLAAIVGFVSAFERFAPEPIFSSVRLAPLRARLLDAIARIPEAVLHSPRALCLPNTIAFSVPGSDGLTLLAALDLAGCCASSGSACSAGSLEPSHVLLAMGAPPERAKSLIRFSLGRESEAAEIDLFASALPEIIRGCLQPE